MTPDMIRQLPAGHALIIRGGYAPVIARLGAAWKDPAYKAARRAGTAVAALTPAARARRRSRPGRARQRPARERWLRAVPDLDTDAAGETRRRRPSGLPVELTDDRQPEGLTAALLQLSGITQKLAELDQRQAGDARELNERITALTALVSELKDTTASQAETLAALDGLDRQVADLAARPRRHRADGDGDRPGYQPSAAPQFWKLDGPARDEAIGRLRAWVEQVYRPGYGHLAATLGDCWEQHPLCLYTLDWLSELWSVLYLQPARTAGTLAGQAEWHTRLLAAGGRADGPRDPRLRPRHRPLPASRPDGAAAMTAAAPPSRRWPTPAHGWPVFPCQPGSKEPATRHGFLDATTDPDQITWWWRRQPDANLAIATGQPGPGRARRRPARPGRERVRRPQPAQARRAPRRRERDRRHPQRRAARLLRRQRPASGKLPRHHLDFRARGGYVLAPPSQVGGKPYQVISHRDESGGLDWATVTGLLEPERHTAPRPAKAQRGDLSHLAAWVERQHEGNRNDGLFWAACRAAEAGDETVLDELANAARSTGLADREIAATISSARRTAGRQVEHQGGREAAIMTARPGRLAPLSATARTDANGTMWRLRSLVAMGHDCTRIARALHVHPALSAGSSAARPAPSPAGSRPPAASCGTPGGTRPRPAAPQPSGAPPPARSAWPRATTGPPPRAWTKTNSTCPATGPGAGTGPLPAGAPRPISPCRVARDRRPGWSHDRSPGYPRRVRWLCPPTTKAKGQAHDPAHHRDREPPAHRRPCPRRRAKAQRPRARRSR